MVGFEPTNNGFADHPLRPLGYISIYTIGVGFEPTHQFLGLSVFETDPFNQTWVSNHIISNYYIVVHMGVEPITQGWEPCGLAVCLMHHIVGGVRLELTMFLLSRFYRPLPSPLGISTSSAYGSRTRVSGLKVLRLNHLPNAPYISRWGEIRTHNVSYVTVLQTAAFTNSAHPPLCE